MHVLRYMCKCMHVSNALLLYSSRATWFNGMYWTKVLRKGISIIEEALIIYYYCCCMRFKRERELKLSQVTKALLGYWCCCCYFGWNDFDFMYALLCFTGSHALQDTVLFITFVKCDEIYATSCNMKDILCRL